MGLICSAKLLDMVPALIESIKVAGLVLVADLSQLETTRTPKGVDGLLKGDHVLGFHDSIDL